jgi:hypothetical protein
MSSEPLDSLSDSSGAEALDSWVEELLRRNGISAHLYVASHLEILPWLEFEVPDQGWMSQVREAVDSAWLFASAALDVVAAVSEQEYFYEFFAARRP